MEISIKQLNISLQNPLFKSIEKNHSSKGGSPASSFLTLFGGGPRIMSRDLRP